MEVEYGTWPAGVIMLLLSRLHRGMLSMLIMNNAPSFPTQIRDADLSTTRALRKMTTAVLLVARQWWPCSRLLLAMPA